MKILSIDHFEIYLYSLNLFNVDLSSILARFVIGTELFLGIGLLFHLYSKQIWSVTLTVLIGFSLFLVYLICIGETENCHCFGNSIQLSPSESLIKNIVLCLLMLFIKPSENKHYKYQKGLLFVVISVAFILPFIISPPDCFFPSDTSTEDVDRALLNKILVDNHIGNDKKLIAFFGAGCKYCKLTAQKINTLKMNAEIDDKNIQYVFWGEKEHVNSFMEKTKSQLIPYSIMDADEFLTFTHGRMPVILLMDNDSLLAKLKYNNLNEKTLDILNAAE